MSLPRLLGLMACVLPGLLLGCNDDSNNGNDLTIFDRSGEVFDGIIDTNANSIPDAAGNTEVGIIVSLDNGVDCAPGSNPITGLTVDYSVPSGVIEEPEQRLNGEQALCNINQLYNRWLLPATPGLYGIRISIDVTRENGRVEHDEFVAQIEVRS